MCLDLSMRNKVSHLFQISYLRSSKLSLFYNWQSRSPCSSLDKPPAEVSQLLLLLFAAKSMAPSSFIGFMDDIFSY